MEFKPRLFQQKAIDFMLEHPRCAIFADCGAGKTTATLSALKALSFLEGARHTLVISTPNIIRLSWPGDIGKFSDFADIDYVVIDGTAEQRRRLMRLDRQIHLISYNNVPWLLELLKHDRWPWPYVVCDESSKLKAHDAIRFRGSALRREVRDEATGRVLQRRREARPGLKHVAPVTDRWINLTATPSPNGFQDLWSQIYLLDQGARLGRTITAYRERWFRKAYDGFSYELLPGAADDILSRIHDICLTVSPSDYVDLPPLVTNTVKVTLPESLKRVYRKLEREFFMQISDDVEVVAFNAAALTGKLRQFTMGAIYTDDGRNFTELHDIKLEALDDLLESIGQSNVIICYYYAFDLIRLKRRYPDAVHFNGDRDILDAWNKGRIHKLLLHPDSAGHGLNLQDGGNVIVFYGLTWALEPYQQVIERIGPMRQYQAGRQNPVFLHHIVAENTIDEAILLRLTEKTTVQDAIKSYMKRL